MPVFWNKFTRNPPIFIVQFVNIMHILKITKEKVKKKPFFVTFFSSEVVLITALVSFWQSKTLGVETPPDRADEDSPDKLAAISN